MQNEKMNGSCDRDFDGDECFRTETPQATTPTEFDLDEYRAGKSQELANISELPTKQKIEIRKPKKEWFRTQPSVRMERLWLHEGDGINDYYLVSRNVVAELPDEFFEAYLCLCINPSGRLFLWPIKCGADGGQEFTESALSHASQAVSKWVRRKWVPRLKLHRAEVNDMEDSPEWPTDLSTREIITRAFGDKVIRSLDHPCLRFVKK